MFVFVKDSKPRRKVAMPVPDSHTLDQFLAQVKAKLKLSGIADIYFSATGVKVTNVNDLQDIDELCVVEGADAPAANGHAGPAASQRSAADLANGGRQSSVSPHGDAVLSPTSMLQQRQQSMQPERHKVVVSTDGLMPSTSASYADEQDHKYARRAHPLKRTLQRLFPNMFSPGLPITNRDAQLESSADGGPKGSRRRRVRRSPYTTGNLLLVLFTMSCVIMMLYLFFWVSSSPTVADMSRPAAQPASSSGRSAQHAAHATTAAAAHGPVADVVTAAVHQPAAVVKQPDSVVGAVTGAGLAAGHAATGGSIAGGGAGLQTASGAAEEAGRAAAVH